MSALALVVEPVYTIDWGTLVITSEEEEVLGIFDFVSKEETNSLKRLFASVDVVSEEQVVCLWWESSILKQA